MIALVLAAVLAQADGGLVSSSVEIRPTDAGVPVITLDSLYTKCGDAPLASVVDGGYFVPEARAAKNNCKLAICEGVATQYLAEDQKGEAHPGTVLALVGGGLALTVVSIVVGYLLPHPAPAK